MARPNTSRMRAAATSYQLRFVAVGLWNTLFGAATYTVALTTVGQARYQEAFALSATVSIIQAYITQRFLVWKSAGQVRRELPRFVAVYALSTAANFALLWCGVHLLGQDPLWTQYVATGALVLVSYFANRYWVFQHKR